MKNLITFYFAPFVVALVLLYCLRLDGYLYDNCDGINDSTQVKKRNYYSNALEFPELPFLIASSKDDIYLLGSSELTQETEFIPFRFIPKHYNQNVIGIGHEGNQCLSIYFQLLSNFEILKNSNLIIILSPGWFESKASKGTHAGVFLEYNTNHVIGKISKMQMNEFKEYALSRFCDLFPNISSPNNIHRDFYFQGLAQKNWLQKALVFPLLQTKNILSNYSYCNNEPYWIFKESISKSDLPSNIKWDSLLQIAEKKVLAKSTNNKMYIEDNYFKEYINEKKGSVQPVAEIFNTEFNDFLKLVKLLKAANAKASFIISPLNPFYYKNIKELDLTIRNICNTLKSNEFIYFNMFQADTTLYDKAVLSDVMHFSDYGWSRINQFIVNNYSLNEK